MPLWFHKIMEKLKENKYDFICISTPLETIIEKEEDFNKTTSSSRRPLRPRKDFLSGRFAKDRTLQFTPYWIQDKDKIRQRKQMLKKHRRCLKLNALSPRKLQRLDSLLLCSEQPMEEEDKETAKEEVKESLISPSMDFNCLSSVFSTKLKLKLENDLPPPPLSNNIINNKTLLESHKSTIHEPLVEKVSVRRSSRLISRDCVNSVANSYDGSVIKVIDKERRPLKQKNNYL